MGGIASKATRSFRPVPVTATRSRNPPPMRVEIDQEERDPTLDAMLKPLASSVKMYELKGGVDMDKYREQVARTRATWEATASQRRAGRVDTMTLLDVMRSIEARRSMAVAEEGATSPPPSSLPTTTRHHVEALAVRHKLNPDLLADVIANYKAPAPRRSRPPPPTPPPPPPPSSPPS